MLVLSRKCGERIHIGDEITVEVRRIAGNRVTLALRAPRDVRILRGELEKAANEFRDTKSDTVPIPRVPIIEGLPVHQTMRDFVI